MACRVCGSTATIEAHLVSRRLHRLVVGDEKHAFCGSTARSGVLFDAKGTFDRDLLCDAHERHLHTADTYGIEFLKRFKTAARPTSNDRIWEIDNPQPTLLVRFVAACVWRRAMSPVRKVSSGSSLGDGLGAWDTLLTNYLFNDPGTYEPMLVLVRRPLLIDGVPMSDPIMLEPAPAKVWANRTWEWMYGDCQMWLLLDYRHMRNKLVPLSANDRNPAPVWNAGPSEFTDHEALVKIIQNMALKI